VLNFNARAASVAFDSSTFVLGLLGMGRPSLPYTRAGVTLMNARELLNLGGMLTEGAFDHGVGVTRILGHL
jgi:hypothetical protein